MKLAGHLAKTDAESQIKTFTEDEWKNIGINELSMEHFVRSNGSYFKPAAGNAIDAEKIYTYSEKMPFASRPAQSNGWLDSRKKIGDRHEEQVGSGKKA